VVQGLLAAATLSLLFQTKLNPYKSDDQDAVCRFQQSIVDPHFSGRLFRKLEDLAKKLFGSGSALQN
jgi:hypothetical protein